MDHGQSFTFGEPADPSSADRVVQVSLLDTLRFDPASIHVKLGETISFQLTNTGQMAHEFVLGDAAEQDHHQAQMSGMDGSVMADEANAVLLDPAAGSSLTWTFTEPGTVLFACHVADHYAAGMVGTILVGDG